MPSLMYLGIRNSGASATFDDFQGRSSLSLSEGERRLAFQPFIEVMAPMGAESVPSN